jgi:hypothetical protein
MYLQMCMFFMYGELKIIGEKDKKQARTSCTRRGKGMPCGLNSWRRKRREGPLHRRWEV